MFEKTSTLAFFPTFVWVFDLKPEDYAPLNEAVIGRIEGALAAPGIGTARHSLQSETDLHELPEFAALMDLALRAADQTLEFLEHERGPLRITGCWANISPPGAHHYEHSQPINFPRGTYNPKVAKGGDTINFHDPRPQAHVIAPRVKTLSTKHANSVNVALKTGRMVLFPAWLRHSVDVNTSGTYRLSVSFNIMLEAFAERVSKPRFDGAITLRRTGRGS